MLDLTKVLDGVEPGMKLYCSYTNKSGKEIGEVELVCVNTEVEYMIMVKDKNGKNWWFTMTGGYMRDDEDCYLFPAGFISWGEFLVEKHSVKHRFKLGDVIECILRGHEYHGLAYAIEEVTPTGYVIDRDIFIPIREEGLWKKL